jgi:hypothetical protein
VGVLTWTLGHVCLQVTDVDIVFMKDPLPLLANKTVDLFFINDNMRDGGPLVLCGGPLTLTHAHTAHTTHATGTDGRTWRGGVWCVVVVASRLLAGTKQRTHDEVHRLGAAVRAKGSQRAALLQQVVQPDKPTEKRGTLSCRRRRRRRQTTHGD